MAEISRVEPKVQAPEKRKKVAAYARVSTDSDRQLHSVSAQVSYYSSLIQQNPEWEYAGVFADSGISGTGTAKRPEFLRMVEEAEAGNIDIILTKSISRFARNTVDLLETVRHLKEIGVEVRFEKERLHTFSGDGELMLSILASFAQEESRSISSNCKWGIRKRFRSGEAGTANKHILGYRYDEEKKQYVIIPEEAEIVRLMFQRYLEGKSLQAICDELNERGYRTVNGCRFQESSMANMLYNEVYAGDIRRQKSFIPDPISGEKVKNRGQLPQYYMEDCHEGILDRDTWNKVLEEKARRTALLNPAYCFTKKIRCGKCGMPYTRRVSKIRGKEYPAWFCRAKKEAGMSCDNVNFPEKDLEKACAEVMGLEAFDEEAFEAEVKAMTVLPGGDIEFHFIGGETRLWKLPPKPEKKPKPEKVRIRPKNVFDGKIFCGKCGKRYGRSISETKDRHMYWHCRSKSNHGVTCDSVNYPDSEIRDIFCKVMGQGSFDGDFFKETVERMVIRASGSIDFHLKDGTVRTFETLKLRDNVHTTTCTEEFRGKVVCGCCGNPYRLYRCQSKYIYWECSGKHKVRTECNGRNIQDSHLRRVTAYIMGTDGFDGEKFKQEVDCITVLPNGSLKYRFKDGSEKTWQKL